MPMPWQLHNANIATHSEPRLTIELMPASISMNCAALFRATPIQLSQPEVRNTAGPESNDPQKWDITYFGSRRPIPLCNCGRGTPGYSALRV
jgi:hypothetical protein